MNWLKVPYSALWRLETRDGTAYLPVSVLTAPFETQYGPLVKALARTGKQPFFTGVPVEELVLPEGNA